MSVCEHDPHCPGHGPAHDANRAMRPAELKQLTAHAPGCACPEHDDDRKAAALAKSEAESEHLAYLMRRPTRRASSLGPMTAVNLDKDRTLSGKARRRARRAARR